jgi:hypothetical protein
MTTKPRNPLLLSLAAMFLATTATWAADEPVATASIPPAPAAPLAGVPKPSHLATATHVVVAPTKPALRLVRPASRERANAERRRQVVNGDLLPPPPDYAPRRYYRGDIVLGPGGPPLPYPWYDRGPPFAGMPYGPRGPLPAW